MIKINFEEPDTDNWKAWLEQCKTEQEKHNKAIEAEQVSKVLPRVYKGGKYNIKSDIYMNLRGSFHGKCAYCESLISGNQPGDVEHFRPKDAVKDINNQTIMLHHDDGLKPHPGYYWLAYCWRNLLPACRECNKIPKKGEGLLIGKGNRFPLEADDYATQPGEEEKEKPLLINPIQEDPEDYLEVDETGTMNARNESPRGQACIDIFGLNSKEALVEGRKRVYNRTIDLVGLAMISVMKRYHDSEERLEEFWDIWNGTVPFSIAGRASIKMRLQPKAVELLIQLYEKLKQN